MPRPTSKYPKQEEAKKLFMESECNTWAEFTAKMKWPPQATRLKYPVAVWVQEKSAKVGALVVQEMEALHTLRAKTWWTEVNKTLDEYPKSVDRIKSLLDYQVQLYLKMAKDHQEGRDKKKFEDLIESNPHVFKNLAAAIKDLREAKYASLMLTDLHIKEFEPVIGEEEKIVFEIAGGSSPANIKKIMDEWNNK